MFGTAKHFLLAPLIGAWLKFSSRSWLQLPTPGERPASSAPGPNADRVLLIGSGIAVGFGVSSGDLALGGCLARGLTAITGRGTSIETVAKFGLRVREVSTILQTFDLKRFDTVVMTLGLDEALYFETADRFRSQLERMLAWLDLHAPERLGLVLVGVPDITAIVKIPRPIEQSVRRHCLALEKEVKSLSANHSRVAYVPFEPAEANLERDGDRHLYTAWAALIAPTVARVLNAQIADPRDPATIEEGRRQTALDELGILDTMGEHRFDRIVGDARRLFGVHGASITFIDRDRQWSKAAVGIDPVDSPRGSALGDATVHNGKLLVVEDASLDDRFQGHPWVVGGSAVRFFAGFPIEAANGERIGAMCVTDPKPRMFSAADDALLGMLARQVQEELWGTPRPGSGLVTAHAS